MCAVGTANRCSSWPHPAAATGGLVLDNIVSGCAPPRHVLGQVPLGQARGRGHNTQAGLLQGQQSIVVVCVGSGMWISEEKNQQALACIVGCPCCMLWFAAAVNKQSHECQQSLLQPPQRMPVLYAPLSRPSPPVSLTFSSAAQCSTHLIHLLALAAAPQPRHERILLWQPAGKAV